VKTIVNVFSPARKIIFPQVERRQSFV